MELGALVCTAKNEDCTRCPIAAQCAWRLAGKPAHEGPPRRGQTYAGTDRQVRGQLLAVLRDAVMPVPQSALDGVWDEPVQRARALDGLVADGLVEPLRGRPVPAAAELTHSESGGRAGVSYRRGHKVRHNGTWRATSLPRTYFCYTTDGQPCGRWLLRTPP